MRSVVAFTLLLFVSAVCAQTNSKTELPELGKIENEDYQQQREEWIREMHRAEPGLNWQAIDVETRDAKAKQLAIRTLSKHAVLSTPSDTFAGGRLVARWIERGSTNVSGRTHTADIDFETDTIFVASAMGNIWKAKTGDSNWTVLNDSHRFGDIRTFRILHTARGKRLFAACNGPVVCRYSDDGGTSWKEATGLDAPKSWGGIKRATVSADESTIYIIGFEWDYKAWKRVTTLYRSIDNGTHFTQQGKWDLISDKCDVWQSRDTISKVYFVKGDSLFTISPSGIFTPLFHFTNDSIVGADGLYLDGKVAGNKTTLALCATTNNKSSMYSSIDNMSNWTYRGFVNGSPFSSNSFRISLDEPLRLYLGNVNVNQSSDTSAQFIVPHQWWEYYGDPLKLLHADIDGIDIFRDPLGNEITIVSTDGGTYLSKDGLQSTDNITYSGIRTSQYYSTYTSSKPYMVSVGAQDQGYQRSFDQSTGLLRMDQIISGDYGHLVSGDIGTSVWGDYPGFVIGYFDARNNKNHHDWSFIGSNKLWLPPIVADPSNSKRVYVACGDSVNDESHLWELRDNGSRLVAKVLSYDFSLGNKDRKVSAMAFSPFDNATMYALSNDGYFYRSTNTGQDWKDSDTTKTPGSHYFYGSVIVPSRLTNHKIWVAGSGYSNSAVYVSTDEGKSFTAIDSSLPKTLVYGMVVSNDERFLYAATEVGPYVYSAEANQWFDLQAKTGLTAPDMVYWSVEKVPESNTIRFGTYGRGIWDLDVISSRDGVHTSEAELTNLLHFQANPSISSGTIQFRFDLPTRDEISIVIYDLSGKRVRNFSTNAIPGAQIWTWDGKSDSQSPLPTGFYTAILKVGAQIEFVKVEIVH